MTERDEIKNPLERNTRITFRTNKELKEQAAAILANLQIDLSTGLNMFLAQILENDGLPLHFNTPVKYEISKEKKTQTVDEKTAEYKVLKLSQGKKGIIVPNGVTLEKHEMLTITFLTECGYDVEFIPKSEVSGEHTPDIIINGEKWEMKTPNGKSKNTIGNQFRRASKQSPNMLLDSRKLKRTQEQILRESSTQFRLSKTITKLWLITKEGEILDFEK